MEVKFIKNLTKLTNETFKYVKISGVSILCAGSSYSSSSVAVNKNESESNYSN